MRKLKALDLFCGGGGACIGMQQAGFEVVGIDIKPRKNYPGEFIQGDALNPPVDIMDFDFVWTSPPCQEFSVASRCVRGGKRNYPNLIPATRKLLKNHPFTCIENVPHAPLRPDLILTGPTVSLPFILRKRIFELSFFIFNPVIVPQDKFIRSKGFTVTVCTCSTNNKSIIERRRAMGLPVHVSKAVVQHVMGIDYFYKFTLKEIGEAVPPPYAYYISKVAQERIKKDIDESIPCKQNL